MTDLEAFEIGKNIAVTPGKVVFQNDLIQLHPVHADHREGGEAAAADHPALDQQVLHPRSASRQNSFIKWAVDQGHTVFVISWVNPDEKLAAKSFEDYMLEGPLAALDAIEKATGEKSANVIGYCLGGTLLACTLAYLAAKGEAERIASATFFTTLVDFKEAGELTRLHRRGAAGGARGEDERARLSRRRARWRTTFNMLRANDLIWSFVVNNYLLGKEPFPFDLLYWNSDSTRMPAAMHSFYLRNMYQKNLLSQPGGIELDGVPIDLRKMKTPTFILSTREDHIAPWKATYVGDPALSGPGAVRAGGLGPHRRRGQSAGRRANTATGPTPRRSRIRRIRTSGWRAPRRSPAPGGRNGSNGSPRSPTARCRRASPAPAS